MTDQISTCWPTHQGCVHRKYIGREVTLNGEPAVILLHGQGNAIIVSPDNEMRVSWMKLFKICDSYSGRFLNMHLLTAESLLLVQSWIKEL